MHLHALGSDPYPPVGSQSPSLFPNKNKAKQQQKRYHGTINACPTPWASALNRSRARHRVPRALPHASHPARLSAAHVCVADRLLRLSGGGWRRPDLPSRVLKRSLSAVRSCFRVAPLCGGLPRRLAIEVDTSMRDISCACPTRGWGCDKYSEWPSTSFCFTATDFLSRKYFSPTSPKNYANSNIMYLRQLFIYLLRQFKRAVFF